MLIFAWGCGSASSKQVERVLTNEEASRLSSTLYLNHMQERAKFEVHTVIDSLGTQANFRGVLDWGAGVGWASIDISSPGFTLTEVSWSRDFIFERHPALDGVVKGKGLTTPVVIRRPLNFQRRLDGIIRVVASLATSQPENASLIRQKAGSAYLRTDELRGEVVDVMRFGWQSVYWINHQTGSLLRFEGRNSVGGMPIIVDLQANSGVEVSFPQISSIIDLDKNAVLLPYIVSF